MEIAAHIIVRGVVQGVGFRYFVYTRASRVGITGYVKNLLNGDVEILAQADRSTIEEFIKEVKVGPRSAHVSDVHIEWKSIEQRYPRFDVHD